MDFWVTLQKFDDFVVVATMWCWMKSEQPSNSDLHIWRWQIWDSRRIPRLHCPQEISMLITFSPLLYLWNNTVYYDTFSTIFVETGCGECCAVIVPWRMSTLLHSVDIHREHSLVTIPTWQYCRSTSNQVKICLKHKFHPAIKPCNMLAETLKI